MKRTKITALFISLCMLITQMSGIIPAFAEGISISDNQLNIDWEGEEQDATLIAAAYDEAGVLVEIRIDQVQLSKGTNGVSLENMSGEIVKYMLWNSPGDMLPLTDAYLYSDGTSGLSNGDIYPLSYDNNVTRMSQNTLSVEYSTNEGETTGTVTIKTSSTDEVKTLLIIKPGADKSNISITDILAIDQAADISQVTIPALDESDDYGTYTVLMGGTSGDIYVGTFSIGGTVLCGDVSYDGDINTDDASQIAQYDIGSVDLTEDQLLAADCDFDGKVNSRDALEILNYSRNYGGGNVGTYVTGNEDKADTETNTADMSVKLVQDMNYSVGKCIVFGIYQKSDFNLKSFSAYIPIKQKYVESVNVQLESAFSSGISYGGYDKNKEQIALSVVSYDYYGTKGAYYEDYGYKVATVAVTLTDNWDGEKISLSDFIVTTGDEHKMSMANTVTAEGFTPIMQDETSGSYSDQIGSVTSEITWKCTADGVMTIGGTGVIRLSPWSSMNVKNIVIEEGITQIYADAFSSFTNLESITIPTSIVRISNLSTLSDKVNFIVDKFNNSFSSFDGALYDKNRIKIWLYAKDEINPDYALPDGITIVDSSAFAGRAYLRSIILPNTLNNIRTKSFYNCTSLETVYIGKNITEIAESAFDGCSMLSTVYYNGTEEEWNNITINSGNDNLTNADVHYNTSVVHYNLNNNDSALENQLFTSGNEITITSTIPERVGYKFLGWSTDPDASEAMYLAGDTTTQSGNLVLYAIWSPDIYDINFVTNDGNAPITVRQGYETEIKYPIISREGYRFDGWYIDENLTQEADVTVMPDENQTFYAKWTEIENNNINILWSCDFEDAENCVSEENGDSYSVMPSLINGDYYMQTYDDINGISLSTNSRGSDDSSYFKIDTEDLVDIENNYLTTDICRFSTEGRGNVIKFNGDSGYTTSDGNNLIFVFDVKMQDTDDPDLIYDTNFTIGKTIVTRDKLGVENDEWAKVMVIYNADEGMKLYKVSDGMAELIASDAENITLSEMAFNAHVTTAIKSNAHPYAYPLVSLDNMYIYTVSKDNFNLETLNELPGFKGRLKKAGNPHWDGTEAKWDSVPYAASYNVSLLRNNVVIKTVNNIVGTSYDFGSDMKNGCAYRFKATAVSDDSDYNDSRDSVGDIYSSTNIQVGDYVQMGTYYNEPILWRCIDVDENGPMLVSDKILCVKAYDAPGNITTGSHTVNSNYSSYWGDSNLRCWLNSDADVSKVVWSCGNPPSSKALDYDAYADEAGFLSNFSVTEKYVINDSIVKAGGNNEEFTDKVSLIDSNHLSIFKSNLDILGTKYQIGVLSDKAAENSEYMNTLTKDYVDDSPVKYAGGDPYDIFLLPTGDGLDMLNSSGSFWTTQKNSYGTLYYGVRPVIHIKDGFELTGEGTEAEPYSLVEDIAAKVSVPTENITPKIYDIIKIPVSVSENTGFASAAVSLSYDKDKYTFVSVTPSLSLLGATLTYSETSDGVDILAVNPANITSDGEIFTVNLAVKENALNSTSEFSIKPIEFFDENHKLLVIDTDNEKLTSILSVSGDIDENSKINSADAVMLSQYLAKYQKVSLTESQLKNADVYTDQKVNIKDMYVLSQYIVNNLTSTSSLMSLFNTGNPQLSATAKYVENDQSMIDVTFSVKGNTGFTGFLFNMGFDNMRLTPVSITTEDVLSSESITSNINESGVDLSTLTEVTALLNTVNDISADGKLYTIRFKINSSLTDSDALAFTNAGFTSKVEDIQLDAPSLINLKNALNAEEESENEVKNLKAVSGEGQVTLSWDKIDNAVAYMIYQDGVWIQMANDTSCTITGLENGKKYTFTVKTFNGSETSEGVSITAIPTLAVEPSEDNVQITYSNGTANVLSNYGLSNAVVIFAEYDSDNLLVSVESKSIVAEAGIQENISKDKAVGEGNIVKVMLWNSLKEMKPLHSVVE